MLWATIAVSSILGAAAFLTFGQTLSSIERPGAGSPGSYYVIGSMLVAGSAVLAGWHTLWLGPVATMAFADGWQRWFFDDSRCFRGMDGIGCYPTSVMWTLALFLPAAVAGATARTILRAARRSGR